MKALLRNRLFWLCAGLAFTLIIGLVAPGISALGQEDQTTDTHSISLTNQQDKLEFLSGYANLPTTPEDAAYHIWYQDNSQGVPGPSDWDIKLVLRLSQEVLPLWLSDTTTVAELETSWADPLLDELGLASSLQAQPEFFVDAYSSELTLYRSDSVLLKRNKTF